MAVSQTVCGVPPGRIRNPLKVEKRCWLQYPRWPVVPHLSHEVGIVDHQHSTSARSDMLQASNARQ